MLTAIELSLKHQKAPSELMVQSFVTIDNLCSDASVLLSEVRALIDNVLQKPAEPETDLSLRDPQSLQPEICSLCTRLRNCISSLSEMLATNINMQFPVSYYESYVFYSVGVT
jgi:hypothetical protein